MKDRTELCADIGYQSINHEGEQLCGDHVEVVKTPDGASTVIVLADGLGSGAKANNLSTLTARIISTMLAGGMPLEAALEKIVATFLSCEVEGVAYSTFTVIRLVGDSRAEIIQYDNPRVVLLRGGKNLELSFSTMEIAGKRIIRAETDIQEDDIIMAFSDGVEHAGVGLNSNFGWSRSDITEYMENFCRVGYTAKTLSTILLDETNRLYGGKPGDDATVCTVRLRRRESVNLIIGPPDNREDNTRMMSLFFAEKGKHIICGGTTSTIAAAYLHKTLRPKLEYIDPAIPPMADLEGADLVTEGVVTISRVLSYAQNYLADNTSYEEWCYKKDAASLIARMLFEDATDINIFVGKAVNPAQQDPALPINFTIKMRLVQSLIECLQRMGKRIKVSYF